MEKVQNLLNFSDFEKSWNPKKQKSTKRTDVGLDILEKRILENDDYEEDDEIIDDEIIDEDDLDTDIDVEDEDEEGDWREQITTCIDDVIQSGVDPDEVYEFLDDLADEYEGENEDEDLDEEDLEDEEIVANDEEGEEEIGESYKFRKFRR